MLEFLLFLQAECMQLTMHPLVKEKIEECAANGIIKPLDVSMVVDMFVATLFGKGKEPAPLDRRYRPSYRDMYNTITKLVFFFLSSKRF